MWPGLLVGIFAISGVTLKLADFYGEKGNNTLQYVFAVISAISFGLLISSDAASSSIILGIIIGVILSRKVNRLNLVLGLILTLFTAIIFGFNLPVPWLLITVSILAFIDELCHDKLALKKDLLAKPFRFRPLLKFTIIFLAVASLIEAVTALGFMAFDLSYDITNYLLDMKGAAESLRLSGK